MPRKRMLWPGYFSSDRLAGLSLAELHTFEGMWVFGDDRGRLKDNALLLWADAWAGRADVDDVDADDVREHINAIVANGQVCRYQVGGGRFLHVIAWDEHQKINHPTPSKIPPCEEHQSLEWTAWWRDCDTATDRWRKAEKADRAAVSDSRSGSLSDSSSGSPDSGEGLTECLIKNRGATHSQSSSVQVSSVQASAPSNVRAFTRPSQRGVS